MIGDLVLTCPACSEPALADDEFCEACGRPLGVRRDGARHHFEVDAGIAAGVSDRGLVHDRNEDALFLATSTTGAVVVVCDGVSSSAAPQVAAQVAAEATGRSLLATLTTKAPADADPDAVATALRAGHRAVLDVPWMASRRRDAPSTTIVAARWDGTTVTVGWAGDSRAYWTDESGARLLTRDHSWAQAQAAAGRMTVAAAEADGRAHTITRWLGDDAPDEPEITSFRPPGPGRLVVCSDGLWNHVAAPAELAGLIAAGGGDGSPLEIARLLVATALQRGGHDNVTVAVLALTPEER